MPTLSLSSPLAIDCWLPRSSHESVHVERERLDSCTCFCPWENAHPGNVSTRACTASLVNARSRGTSLYTARLPAALLRGPGRRLVDLLYGWRRPHGASFRGYTPLGLTPYR